MIRSYHKVGRSFLETRSYTMGKRPDGTPLRLPFSPPIIGVAWFFAALVVVFAFSRMLGVGTLPSNPTSMAYVALGLWYIGIPVGVAYVMTVAEVEGRRVHVILQAWLAQGRAKRYVGGYLPVRRGALPTVRYKRPRVIHRV